jgi:response regulator of citrate/malate metabolism
VRKEGRAISPDRTGPATIAVLVVDDDPTIAAGHAQYVARVPGFEVAGVAHSGAAALTMLDRTPVDLVLLDFFLPDMSGLDVCRAIRSRERLVDVIAVTSARDLAVVRALVAQGVVQYLLKPFTAAAFRQRLERYAEYRRQVASTGGATDQGEVDRALAALRGNADPPLPKGMSAQTLESVLTMLDRVPEARSASPG